ncbi:MAG: peptigoglycan-binding protein LysM [Gammaproteobacteria bacterium]|uniref:FimV family protein n=1 Tax=Stutzerimonas xanthomarina TaxID=271420 RepID=UPI00190A3074|nr:FimV family protein [Stutzerimonas xanthomarina]MBU0522959.1 peptigoglycan-binding protein LysM [Gammaproteobacteria bacterium]MBK3848516.1 tetratricopeptide repeat protein [Stutzerimonas xanthomarina]MBU0812011.1 peptigoglycan-binding protein LysM [Gammaproteobacteria bacterium]MBU0853053.1 peptigoglycan-binding protein LysM [Gammaproteobacteria bacterium]MBU1302341.1 peptigoglycan-binding protein LysM [Gammaproteobacteria bacterium]|tara:strand:+ start:4688 stop:7423 length:2736 start_codon:yes stop_codon:yes gene_type:complete
MVRVRNLVLAIAAATALTSEMAYALGLGEVTLKSALNQPLVAEIELLDAKTLAPGEVVPVLASAEDFNRAGVDRQYFLTDLTFTPVLRPDGKSVIRVSSTKPVREPYLNFLIEVLWPSGRLLREYTLLLDPPLYSPEIAASVAPQLPVATPVSRPAAAPQVASRSTSSSSTTPASQGGEYKVTPNDTLWEIAERARLGGTVHQTMLAIQDINPDAFIGNNINRMKNGQVLRLPSAEQIGRRSQAEAIQEVAQQNASWRQAAGPGAPAARQLDATQRGSADAAPSRSEQGDNLRLVAPAAGKSTVGSDGGDGADAAALRDKLAVSEESLDSSRRENLDLKDRLNDLQGQLDKLQRLMQLKDDQLAKLQAQLASGAEAGLDLAASPSPSVDEAGNSATPVTQAAEVVPEVATEANPAPSAAPQPPQSEKSEAPEPDVQAPAAPAAPVSAPQEPQADGYVDELMGSPVLLGVLGGSALLLLLVGLMVLSRRNAMREAELQESLLADNSTDSFYVAQHELDSSDTESADLGASHDAGQVSADSLAGTGSDPLAEADIYIAYGRFNQAAELLQNALNDEPQRSDLRLKLMEVYAELGDREGFARQEAELREIGGSSAEIEQTKARYPAMAAAGFGAVAASVSASDDLDSFSLDDLELEEPAPLAEQQADDDFDLSLDDLELEDDLTDLSVTPVGGSAVERDDVNFDETGLDAAAQDQAADDFSFDLDEPATSSNVSLDDELAGFSLDLDEPSSSSAAGDDLMLGLAGETKPASSESVDELDFGLTDPDQPTDMPDEFDLSLDDEPVAEPAPETFSSELEVVEADLEDLSRDFNEPLDQSPAMTTGAVEPVASTPEALDDDFDFFADTDETTTKLDLARAYIDMGDAEGARDILDEVMSEGSDNQQQEAREMLAKLA